MNDPYPYAESDSPPWGNAREALTARERRGLLLLVQACLATDLALVIVLARVFC